MSIRPTNSAREHAEQGRKERICKTFIRRFDSDPRLQSNQVDPTACKPLPRSPAAGEIDEHKAKRGGVPGQNPDANISGPERSKRDWDVLDLYGLIGAALDGFAAEFYAVEDFEHLPGKDRVGLTTCFLTVAKEFKRHSWLHRNEPVEPEL